MEGISGDSAEVSKTLSKTISDALILTSLMKTEQIQKSFRTAQIGDVAKISYYKDLTQEELWLDCARNLTAVITMTIEFAKMVPGFLMNLTQDDQITLLKTGCFAMSVLRMSRYYDLQTDCVLYKESMLPQDAFVTQHPEEMQLVVRIFELVKSIAELKLTETELALYSAAVLSNPDLRELRDRQKVRRIYDAVLRALRSELDRSRKADATAVVDALMAKIPQLEEVSLMHRNLVANLSRALQQRLPPLYCEVFLDLGEQNANQAASRADAG